MTRKKTGSRNGTVAGIKIDEEAMEKTKDKTRRNAIKAAVLLGFSYVLSSCAPSSVYNTFEPIPNEGWTYEFRPTLEVQVGEAEKNNRYKVYVNLRHTPLYRYSNLFVRWSVHAPNSETPLFEPERVELTLAEVDGRWTGKNNGDLYTHSVLVKDKFAFPDTGKFVIHLEQHMRDNPLKHIVAAGIRLELIR